MDAYQVKGSAQQAETKAQFSGGLKSAPSYPSDSVGCEALQKPLIYQLHRQARAGHLEADRTQRALAILEKHPEFEELIELLKIVRGY